MTKKTESPQTDAAMKLTGEEVQEIATLIYGQAKGNAERLAKDVGAHVKSGPRWYQNGCDRITAAALIGLLGRSAARKYAEANVLTDRMAQLESRVILE